MGATESVLIEWLPEKVVANMLGKDRLWLTVQRLPSKRRGRKNFPIPPWYRIGGRIVYKRADVEAFIESCRGR